MNWLSFTVGFRYFQGLVRWWIRRYPVVQLNLSDKKRFELLQLQFSKSKPHPKDVEVMSNGNEFRLFLRSAREAFAQRFDGFL